MALMLDGYTHLDVRPANVFARDAYAKAMNVPLAKVTGFGAAAVVEKLPSFMTEIYESFPDRSAGILVVGDKNGEFGGEAVAALKSAGYSNVCEVSGGFPEWTKVFGPKGNFRDGRPASAAAGAAPAASYSAPAPSYSAAPAPSYSAPAAPSAGAVSPEAGMALMLDGYTHLDVRPANVFARDAYSKAVNVPAVKVTGFGPSANVEYLASFMSSVQEMFPSKASGILVVGDANGAYAGDAVKQLQQAGYSAVAEVSGGFPEWTKVFGPKGNFRDGRPASAAAGAAPAASYSAPAASYSAPAPSYSAPAPTYGSGAGMSPADAMAAIKNGAVYLDVRPRNLFNRDGYSKATNVPIVKVTGFGASAVVEELPSFVNDVMEQCDASTQLVVGGGDDDFAAKAVAKLQQAGYSSVSELAGGFPAWTKCFRGNGQPR